MVAVGFVLSLALAALHLFARRVRFREIPRSRLLSAAGGVAVAYIFVRLLPELGAATEHVAGLLPIDHVVYLLALTGLALFYGVERAAKNSKARHHAATGEPRASSAATWLSFVSYGTYNALIGYALVRDQDELQAAVLFAIAMGLHFAVNDHSLRTEHRQAYDGLGRWFLAAAVVVGAFIGLFLTLSEAMIGALLAFIGGGVILNVMKEELPEERESSFGAFMFGAVAYTLLLLALA